MDVWARGASSGAQSAAGGTRRALMVVALVTALVLAMSPPAFAPPSCNLVPQVVATTVNQGLGSYSPLVRGKDTLVRLFLSMPSCAAQRDSISLTGASLTVSMGSTTLATIPAPLGALSPAPALARFGDAAMTDHPGDPVFLIAGSALAPSSTTGAFTASFRASLTYVTSKSSTAGTVSPSAFSRSFENKTNAVRTLVVPLGDPTSGTGALSAAGNAAVQSAMIAAQRALPVPAGTSATLDASSAGVRYSVNPNALDITAVMSGGTFCGTTTTFTDKVQPVLADFRQQYNSANAGTAMVADRVLGVLDEPLHGGDLCALGFAMLGSAEAYSVAFHSPEGALSATSSTVAMELAHTFNQVDASSPNYDPFSEAHSFRTEADTTDPSRGYNLSTGKHVPDDRTVMRVSSGWNGATAIFEKHEYDALRCALGGQTSCPATTPIGTPVGVPAAPAYVLVGTTTGVLDSFATVVPLTTPDASSSHRLVFRNGAGATLATFGVPVTSEGQPHDDSGGPDRGPGATETFSVAAPLPAGTAAVALLDEDGVVYERVFNAAPRVTSFTARAAGSASTARFTTHLADDRDPAVSAQGLVAWVRQVSRDSDRLLVAPAGGGDPVTVPTGEGPLADPAWSQDGTRLAYVQGGSLYAVDVDATQAPVSFGDPALLRARDDADYGPGPASHPTWSQDGQELAFESEGRVHVLALDGGSERVVGDRPGQEGHPSWSTTPGVDRIALVREGCEDCFEGIVTVDPRDAGDPPGGGIVVRSIAAAAEPEVPVAEGSQPSWDDDGRIAFVDPSGGVSVVAADGSDTPEALTADDSDSAPSKAGSRVAFEREFLDCGTELCLQQREIMLLSTAMRLTVRAEDETPELLRASFFTFCRGEYQPLAVAVAPAAVVGGAATFELPFTPIACDGASVFVDVNDGASRSGLVETTSDLVFGVEARPVPAIHVPAPGAELLEGEALLVEGSATDGEDGGVGDLHWLLECGAHRRTATGAKARFSAPLPPGACMLALTATDTDGNAETTTSALTVLADGDNDWLADELERTLTCFPPGAATDGLSGLDDSDGDGIPNVDDRHTPGGPCSPHTAYTAVLDIMPSALNTKSQGKFFTVELHLKGRRLEDVDPAAVHLTNVAGYPIPAADDRFHAKAWHVGDAKATAKFLRAPLLALLREHDVRGRTVSIDVAGSSRPATRPSPYSFSGTGFTRVLP